MDLAGLSLTQTLFDQLYSGLKAATREFFQNQQLTEEQVIERVANNYYQVLRSAKPQPFDSTYQYQNIIKGHLTTD
jgi:hypothetical protein